MTEDTTDRIISAPEKTEDQGIDISLRPKSLEYFVGQEKIKANLRIFMEAAKKRREPIEHVLLYGNPGLGKTTLSQIIGREMGVNVQITSGPAIEKKGDLAAILTKLQEGDILFIDEIHRLNKIIEESLYPAMEDGVFDIIIGKGPSASTLRLDLPKFTVIGATTRMSLLSAPLRDRFGNIYHLNFYEDSEIAKIIKRNAKLLNVEVSESALKQVAKRSRRTPRIANRLLKRVRDYAEVKGDGIVNEDLANLALEMLEVDSLGLDQVDRHMLEVIIDKFNGGPVGLNTLAAATALEMETIEDIYEPFLMQLGFLRRTPRGRVVSELACNHLGKDIPEGLQEKLL